MPAKNYKNLDTCSDTSSDYENVPDIIPVVPALERRPPTPQMVDFVPQQQQYQPPQQQQYQNQPPNPPSPATSTASLMTPTGLGSRVASSSLFLTSGTMGGAVGMGMNSSTRKGFLRSANNNQPVGGGGMIATPVATPCEPLAFGGSQRLASPTTSTGDPLVNLTSTAIFAGSSSPLPSAQHGQTVNPLSGGQPMIVMQQQQGQHSPVPPYASPTPSATPTTPTPSIPMCSVLVLGGPQCGKSSFVNACRQVNITSGRWTEAPVGRCGLYGTMNIVSYPNSPREATWQLIDTPGRIYTELDSEESDDSLLLGALFDGMALPVQLIGRGAVTVAELSTRPPCKENTPFQAIVLISAADLVEDAGSLTWLVSMGSKARHSKAPQADATVANLRQLVQRVREHLNNEPPLVLVTFMDKVGGAGNASARAAVVHTLDSCVPNNCVFFAGFTPDPTCQLKGIESKVILDSGTQAEMLRIFTAFRSKFNWGLQNTLYKVRKMMETRRLAAPAQPQPRVGEMQLPQQPMHQLQQIRPNPQMRQLAYRK